MEVNMKIVQQYAGAALTDILRNCDETYSVEHNSGNGSMTIKLENSISVCGYSVLPQFMFMKDGEVYFFALLDKIDLTVENAALAFEASTSSALNVAIDEYLTVQLGAYLFNESQAGQMIERYFDDLIYLLEEDNDFKKLLSRMY